MSDTSSNLGRSFEMPIKFSTPTVVTVRVDDKDMVFDNVTSIIYYDISKSPRLEINYYTKVSESSFSTSIKRFEEILIGVDNRNE